MPKLSLGVPVTMAGGTKIPFCLSPAGLALVVHLDLNRRALPKNASFTNEDFRSVLAFLIRKI